MVIHGVLGLALLVVVPLGATDQSLRSRRIGFSCGALATASLFANASVIAGLLTLPWTACTFWNASHALKRVARSRTPELSQLCLEAAWIFLSVGAIWLTAARFGYPLLGFSEPIVSLTAVHFHFAGFAATRIVGLLGRARPVPDLYPVPVLGVLVGTPLVALGITFSALVEVIGALLLAAAMLVLAWMLLRSAPTPLKLSGASLFVSMILAGVYAVGEYTGLRWLSIPTLVWSHGLLNALGFALPALIVLRGERHLATVAPG